MFSGIGTPPFAGKAVDIVVPDPIYSKVYEEARINDCFANGTVDPMPIFDGRF
jgi:monomeric isocitrate dehydrogenase